MADMDGVDEQYGRWRVLGPAPKRGQRQARVRCECGVEQDVRLSHLKSGASTSCGCYSRELNTKHGLSESPEYAIWVAMKQRCENESYPDFGNYGGRGIAVCSEWSASFAAFYRDVGPRPSPELSIDRIDNNGNYELGNVRWATRSQQQKNRRRSRPSAAEMKARREKGLVCSFSTPWEDHFPKPIGNGKGCRHCETPGAATR